MMALFDKEYIMKVYVEDVAKDMARDMAKEAAKKAAKEAAEKATKEATEKTNRQTAESLLQLGKLSVEDIAASIPDLSIEDVRQIQEQLQGTL